MPRDKPLAIWKRKKVEVEARIKELERIRFDTVSWLEKASSNRTEMLWRRTEYLKFLQKQQRLNEAIKDTALKLDSARRELKSINENISSLEKNRTQTIFALGGMAAIMVLMISLFIYGPFAGDSSLTGAAISEFGEETAANVTGEIAAKNGTTETAISIPVPPPFINDSGQDLIRIPDMPTKGYLKKNKTLDELIAETGIAGRYEKSLIKEIRQPNYATTEIVFNGKSDRTLIIHAPRFDGMAFSEFVPLQEKNDFTYIAAFEGTAVEIEFDSPEIKQDKAEKQFAKIKENSTDQWKIKYDFKLPSTDFIGRIRVSSNSQITISDPALGEMDIGKFFLSFKREKENGYTITMDQVNDKIVFVYLAKDYAAEGRTVDDLIQIDPTLTLSSGVTSTLCGTVKNYSVIDVQSGGVLKICARNATNPGESGYVNISLGYAGNFSLSAGGFVEGIGAGGTGGAGCATNSCTSTQGGNGTGQNGVAATTANGGGGGGATKGSPNGDSAAGAGGGFGGAGGKGGLSASGTQSTSGATYGASNDEFLYTGSGGGGSSGDAATTGGAGGGGIKIETGAAGMIWIQGTINVSGVNGTNQSGVATDTAGAGGGSGGHVILKTGNLIFSGTPNITAIGRSGGSSKGATTSDACAGGGGGGGRILYVYQTLSGSFPQNLTERGGEGVGGDSACDAVGDALGAQPGNNGTIFYNSTTFTTLANVTSVVPALNSVTNITKKVEIGASINFLPQAVIANVTLPNGTIDVVQLGFYDSDKYNASYTFPLLNGLYNITVIANDSSGRLYKDTTNVSVKVDCATITRSNFSLTLDQNVTSAGICFDIQGNDVRINCAGYSINYSVSQVGNAVRSIDRFNNTRIENCIIKQGDESFTLSRTINFSNTVNATIKNNSIYTMSSRPIIFDVVANSTIVENTVNSTLGAALLQIQNTNSTNISLNIITTSNDSAYGIVIQDYANFNTITSNRISTTGLSSTGIIVSDVSTGHNTVSFNNVTTDGGSSSGIQFQLETFDNILDSNKVQTLNYHAIILLHTGLKNNTIRSNNITTTGTNGYGITLENASYTVVENNTIKIYGSSSTTAAGILLRSGTNSPTNNTLLINNNISSEIAPEIIDESGITTVNYLIYNNSFGEIKWIDNGTYTFVQNVTLNITNDQGLGLGNNLFIGNNTAAVNLSAFNMANVNSTANITLKGLDLSSISSIRFLGTYNTNSKEIQQTGTDCLGTSCTQLSYSGGTLVFNASFLGSFAANFTEAPADALGPNVTNMTPPLNSRFNFSTAIEISANVTDSTAVSAVNVTILLPNGSITPLTLSTTVLTGKYNISYAIPNLTGFYNVSFGANDTLNNINSTEFTNFTAVNAVPVVHFVSPVHPQSITEGGLATIINISFNVSDNNGFGDIDNNSAEIRISLAGETDRFNQSCVNVTQYTTATGTGMSFNCSVSVWYFDGPGNWIINVSVRDMRNTYAENRSTTFELLSTTGMTMAPNALTWPTIELGRSNLTSNNDPIRINNTGNKNIAVGGVSVTGYNLQGLTTLTDFIYAGNFSIFPVNGSVDCTGVGCLECNGTQLINGTNTTTTGISTPITVANITRGNNTIDDGTGASGQEELFICLRLLPLQISRQSYDTSGGHTAPWTIAVS